MTNQLNNTFDLLGLSDKDAEVYVAGLKSGPMLASDLAKECKITRPNAYDVLKRLMSRGLATRLSELYGGKFKMADPNEILSLLERRKEEQEIEIGEFQKALPLLSSSKARYYAKFPLIEYFEGEGVTKILLHSLEVQESVIYMATSAKRFVDLVGGRFAELYVKRRVKAGIRSKTIREFGKHVDVADEYAQSHEKYLREVRFAPKGIHFDSTVILFDNRVGIITKEDKLLGTLITSTPIARTFQNWFDVLWKASR